MKKLIAALIVAATASAAVASVYRVENVSRKDTNVYIGDYGRILIKTKYCYEYASYENVLVDTNARKVYFSSGVCELEGVYRI